MSDDQQVLSYDTSVGPLEFVLLGCLIAVPWLIAELLEGLWPLKIHSFVLAVSTPGGFVVGKLVKWAHSSQLTWATPGLLKRHAFVSMLSPSHILTLPLAFAESSHLTFSEISQVLVSTFS